MVKTQGLTRTVQVDQLKFQLLHLKLELMKLLVSTAVSPLK